MKKWNVLLPMVLLASCVNNSVSKPGNSGGDFGSAGVNQNEVIEMDGSNVQGFYAAPIWPMNYNLHFKTIGAVGVSRVDDTFTAAVNFKYGPKEATVKQAIYTARRCPTINDDLNKDAYIDILEARLAIGKVVIPFDADLESQMGGSGQYPAVDAMGKMFYSKTASFDRMFDDLKSSDEDPADQIIKLKEDEGITLPGRIVLFQGMPKKVTLPDSVATTDGEDKYDSIPIGCAVLWKVKEMPAELSTAQPSSI
jgi:hypothetical protein